MVADVGHSADTTADNFCSLVDAIWNGLDLVIEMESDHEFRLSPTSFFLQYNLFPQ